MALKTVKCLVGLIMVMLAAASLRPSDYSAQRSMTINAPADKVFPLVANQTEWRRWSVWNQRDPNMPMTYARPEGAAGCKWAWKSKFQGDGGMQRSAVEANKRVAYVLTMKDMTPATSDLKFSTDGAGTQVA